MNPPFTPTEKRILALLGDGKPHTKAEIVKCLYDDMGAECNIHVHIKHIRRKLLGTGAEIVCQFHEKRHQFRLIRPVILSAPEEIFSPVEAR